MGRKMIEWDIHIENYNDSGMSIPKFCKLEKLNIHTFRSKLYTDKADAVAKPVEKPKYLEFDVRTELSLSLESDGSISIRGLNPIQIPVVLQACSDAVSR